MHILCMCQWLFKGCIIIPPPLSGLFFNSSDIVITISIFTDADVVVCYYVFIVRQMCVNHCNITTFITKNLFIASILFWIYFYCDNCCNFQLSLSTNNSSKKSVTEMEIVMEHGIIHPSNSLSTKKLICDRDGIWESKWKHDKYDCILICTNSQWIYRVARG